MQLRSPEVCLIRIKLVKEAPQACELLVAQRAPKRCAELFPLVQPASLAFIAKDIVSLKSSHHGLPIIGPPLPLLDAESRRSAFRRVTTTAADRACIAIAAIVAADNLVMGTAA